MEKVNMISRLEEVQAIVTSLLSELKQENEGLADVLVSDGLDDCEKAIEVIRKTMRASVSHFQRHLGWGYNHAQKIMEELESRGVVGPAVDGGKREVFIEKTTNEIDVPMVEQAKCRLSGALDLLFENAVKMSNGGLFNGAKNDVDAKISKYISERSLKLDCEVVEMLMEIWSGVKEKLNGEFLACATALRISPDALSSVAKDVDLSVRNAINAYSGSFTVVANDRWAQQKGSLRILLAHAKELFTDGIFKVSMNVYDVGTKAGMSDVCRLVSMLESHIVSEIRRYGILTDDDVRNVDVFSMDAAGNVSNEIEWSKYKEDESWGERMIRECSVFRILIDDQSDVITASQKIVDDLERKGYRVRMCVPDTMFFKSSIFGVVKNAVNLNKINPDFEIVRYPKSIEVKCLRK